MSPVLVNILIVILTIVLVLLIIFSRKHESKTKKVVLIVSWIVIVVSVVVIFSSMLFGSTKRVAKSVLSSIEKKDTESAEKSCSMLMKKKGVLDQYLDMKSKADLSGNPGKRYEVMNLCKTTAKNELGRK